MDQATIDARGVVAAGAGRGSTADAGRRSLPRPSIDQRDRLANERVGRAAGGADHQAFRSTRRIQVLARSAKDARAGAGHPAEARLPGERPDLIPTHAASSRALGDFEEAAKGSERGGDLLRRPRPTDRRRELSAAKDADHHQLKSTAPPAPRTGVRAAGPVSYRSAGPCALIILDACRQQPAPPRMPRRQLPRGLAAHPRPATRLVRCR